jgi:Cu2+-exporting ATPase
LSGRIDGTGFRLGKAGFAGGTRELSARNDSAVWLADGRGWIARFELADPLRTGSIETVEAFRRDGLALSVLSGDGADAVAAVAGRLGIDDWQAGRSPEQKMEHVKRLQEQGRIVLMVGDGVNDAPVLAAADVSITVQGASELANSAADLVVTGESLAWIEVARGVARKTRRVIVQNLAWAIAYNLLAVPLAASGALQPWMAALGMSASSLLVVANAARLAGNRGAGRREIPARESVAPA